MGSAKQQSNFSHLRVRPQPDNYCLFESVVSPGCFVNFLGNANPGNIRTKNVTDASAQFFIRMVVRVCVCVCVCDVCSCVSDFKASDLRYREFHKVNKWHIAFLLQLAR